MRRIANECKVDLLGHDLKLSKQWTEFGVSSFSLSSRSQLFHYVWGLVLPAEFGVSSFSVSLGSRLCLPSEQKENVSAGSVAVGCFRNKAKALG